jgi:hypothetical protein
MPKNMRIRIPTIVSFNIFFLCVGTKLLDYVALPGARLVVEWVWSHPAALQQRGFTARPQIWPGLARQAPTLFLPVYNIKMADRFSMVTYFPMYSGSGSNILG